MKKTLTLLAVTIVFTVNAQVQYVQTNNSGSPSSSAIGGKKRPGTGHSEKSFITAQPEI